MCFKETRSGGNMICLIRKEPHQTLLKLILIFNPYLHQVLFFILINKYIKLKKSILIFYKSNKKNVNDCVFQGMVIVFAASQLKSIYSTYVKKDEIPDDNVVDRSYIGKRLITYCKM